MRDFRIFMVVLANLAACDWAIVDEGGGSDPGPGEPVPDCLPLDQPFAGDVYVETVEHLEALAGYSSITGKLVIQFLDHDSLAPLSCLRQVGQLYIGYTELRTLHGLENLEEIDIDLEVRRNDELVHLEGLSGLTTVQGISISLNPTLGDLRGLGSVAGLPGALSVQKNIRLHSLAGLTSLASVGQLGVFDNPQLVALDLDALTAIDRTVHLVGNDKLPNCVGHAMTALLVDPEPFVCVHDNLDDACPYVCE